VLDWAHIGQTPIHHLTSGSFTSYSKGREKVERPPGEGHGEIEDLRGAHSGEIIATSHIRTLILILFFFFGYKENYIND
jgi:hypothetical protein